MPVNATPDLTTLPHVEETRRFILVNITAPTAPESGERPAVNLSLVLDRSGSMSGDKMRSAITAAKSAIGRLSDRDHFSVVIYDSEIEVIVPSTRATAKARAQASRLVDRIGARGTTNLSTGWLTGCGQVGDHLGDGMVGRVLLLTDGQANEGIQSVEALRQHAAELYARGVATTTFGIGIDFNEVLLKNMAQAGGGNFYFIENAQQIEDCITSETGEALEVTARDASLVVRVPPGVKMRCRSGHAAHETEGALHVALGNLVSEQEVALVLEARIPAGSEPCVLLMRMADADGRMADDTAQIALQRSSEAPGRPHPEVVTALVAAIADKGRLKALEASQHGEYQAARRHLQGAIDRITPYQGIVPEAAALIGALRDENERFSEMSAYDRKKMYMSSAARSVSRRESGYAGRRAGRAIALLCATPLVMSATDPARSLCRDLLKRDLVPERAHMPDVVLDPQSEEAWIARASDKFHHLGLRIVVVGAPLHDGTFSHWHADHGTALVSVHGVPPHLFESFLAYEVLLHGPRLLSDMYDPARLFHDEARDCLFDLCRDRAQISAKLPALHLCPTCADALDACGLDVVKIQEACQRVRQACVSPRT